jgi:hypothetical protein
LTPAVGLTILGPPLTTVSMSADETPRPTDHHRHLSRSELYRLTLFKWRYTLESLGFAAAEVEQLLFLTWLRATARITG